jgi:xylulokinase
VSGTLTKDAADALGLRLGIPVAGGGADAPLAALAAGAAGLVFLPYLAGERTPHMNPHARGLFLGLTAAHGRGHLVRAVMEGAAFALFDAFALLRSLGAAAREIVLCGGGAQSGLWRQIVADVFGMPVRPLRTVEQSALGAALVAGAAIGQHDLATAAVEWATYDAVVMPDLGNHARYAELLEIFRNAYRVHVEDFERLGDLDQ